MQFVWRQKILAAIEPPKVFLSLKIFTGISADAEAGLSYSCDV